jgi:hypothetical protein
MNKSNKQGRPTIAENEKLKPRFTLTMNDDDWKRLKDKTEHPLSFTREAIIEKLEKERQEQAAQNDINH